MNQNPAGFESRSDQGSSEAVEVTAARFNVSDLEASAAEEASPLDADAALGASEPGVRQLAANNIVKNHVIAAMALGFVPLPVFDLVALTGVQLKLLHRLCEHYGVDFSSSLGKSLITALVGGVLPVALTATFASFFKVIPGFGSLAGGASVAVLGGALTYAVGRVFSDHFEAGGTLADFSPRRYRALFKKQFTEGKTVASELKPEGRNATDGDHSQPRDTPPV